MARAAFEKMLYDNAQLVSLYSEAHTWHRNPLYEQTVDEIITFIKRELTSPEHGFYSALDADSEGGRVNSIFLPKPRSRGSWAMRHSCFVSITTLPMRVTGEEEHSNVLFRREGDAELAAVLGLPEDTLVGRISASRKKVFEARSQRVRPGLDNKILASWNGLMLKGLCEAYRAFNKPEYLELALNMPVSW